MIINIITIVTIKDVFDSVVKPIIADTLKGFHSTNIVRNNIF